MTSEKSPKRPKKIGRAILTAILILALAAGVFLLYRYSQKQKAQAAIDNLDLASAQRETLISSINGTGTVQPAQDALLVWKTSGRVGKVSVSVGSLVRQGEVMAALDEHDLPLDILQARMEKLTAQQALENLEASTALKREQLKVSISDAQTNLTSLNNELTLLRERECTAWRSRKLQTDYDDAQTNYRDNPTELNLRALQAAQTALDFCKPESIALQINALTDRISLQEANISGWQADLEKIAAGPDPVEREKLELQLAIAEKRLEARQIIAPFAGTVTSVNTVTGALVSAGAQAVSLADLSSLKLKVLISEVDIPSIAIGQKAVMVFDAYYNEPFTGEVLEIAGAGEPQAGVVNYAVTISIEGGQEALKPGMTASVLIQTAEKPNALVVPIQAVTSKNGTDVVYVMRNNKPVAVEVQVGAYSDDLVEILSGNLEEGEYVVVNPPTSVLNSIPGFYRNR